MALTKVSTGMLEAGAASVDLNLDDGTLYIDVANGRVGVGTTTPSTSFEVSGDTTLASGTVTGALSTNTLSVSSTATVDTLTVSTTATVPYDNTISGLTATNVQSAITELNTLLGGGNVGSQATWNIYEFTTTANQTQFDISSQGSPAPSYVPGYVQVYLNGILLGENDYTAVDGSTINFSPGIANAGQLLSVVVLDSFNTAELLRVTSIDASASTNSISIDSTDKVTLSSLDVTGTVTTSTAEIGTGGASDANAFIDLTGDTTYTDFGFRIIRNSGANGNTELRHRGTGDLIIEAVEAGEIVFETSDLPRMRIDSSGKVGIGTIDPVEDLVILGPDAGSVFLQIGNTTTTVADNNGLYVGLDGNSNGYIGTRHNADLVFETNDVEAMRIDSSGNLILKGNDLEFDNGTVLHRITHSGTDLLIRADYGNALASSTMQFSVDGVERMRIDNNGNILTAGNGDALVLSAQGTATDALTQYSSDELKFLASGWDTNGSLARTGSWMIRNDPVASIYPDFDLNFYDDFAGEAQLKVSFHARGTTNHADPKSATFYGNVEINQGDQAYTNAGPGNLTINDGDLLVGKTSVSARTTAGHEIWNTGFSRSTVDNNKVVEFIRTSGSGEIIALYEDQNPIGSIGSASGGSGVLTIDSAGTTSKITLEGIIDVISSSWSANEQLTPTTTGVDLGNETSPWDNIYLDGQAKIVTGREMVMGVSGSLTSKGDGGGWSMGHLFYGSSGTYHGGFGALGNVDDITYYWIGPEYNDPNTFIVAPAGNAVIRYFTPTGATSSPTGTSLEINSSADNYISFRNDSDDGSYAGLTFTDNNTAGYIVFRNFFTGGTPAADETDCLIFGTYQDFVWQTGVSQTINGKTERMRLTQAGDVGIGTNSPDTKLEVLGDVSFSDVNGANKQTFAQIFDYNVTNNTAPLNATLSINSQHWSEYTCEIRIVGVNSYQANGYGCKRYTLVGYNDGTAQFLVVEENPTQVGMPQSTWGTPTQTTSGISIPHTSSQTNYRFAVFVTVYSRKVDSPITITYS